MKATRPVNIDGLEFDALIESEEQNEADVPAYPIETGFEISDAIILKPKVLSMTLYLTNTPVTWQGRNRASVQDRLARLRQLFFAKKMIIVTTSTGVHKNMVIVSFSDVRNVETGPAREVPITFQEVRITQSQKTTIPDSYMRSGATGEVAGTADTTTGTSSNKSTPPPASSGSKGSVLSGLGKFL